MQLQTDIAAKDLETASNIKRNRISSVDEE
jgi:hypothetical protein